MRKVFFFIAIWFFSLVATAAPQKIEIVDLVQNGDIEGVRAALDAGTDVNAKSPDGATALQGAVHGDQELMVELLLEVGADVGITNRYGVSAASLAAENGNSIILKRLLEAGSNPEQTMPGGETLLMTAARTGEPETMRTLLGYGANPNRRETVSYTHLTLPTICSV